MKLSPTVWYRAGFFVAVIALAVTGWIVGGTVGPLLVVFGFIALWTATRFVNRIFGSFLLGDENQDEVGDWDPS
jgi:hypothetical protein